MKKNLNIAYLNGAEGLHKRGGASSGGSSGGDDNISYYKVKQDWTTDFNNDYTLAGLRLLASSVKCCKRDNNANPIGIVVYSSYNTSENDYCLAFAFMPVIGPTVEYSYDSLEDGVSKGLIPPIDHVVERCTSDEFYNKKPIYKFRIHIYKDIYTGVPAIIGENNYAVKEYDFEADMSLDEWLNSKYNVDNLTKSANSDNTYIYAPYVDNGKKAFLLEGHGYNPLQYDKPYMFRFFNGTEVNTDEGKVFTHLGFNNGTFLE